MIEDKHGFLTFNKYVFLFNRVNLWPNTFFCFIYGLPMSQQKGKKKDKVRLDRLLVERGLAESLEKAQAIIFAGQV